MWIRALVPIALVLVACAGRPEPTVSFSLRAGESVAAALSSAARDARRSIAVDPLASYYGERALQLRDVPWSAAVGQVARDCGLELRTIEGIEVLVVRDPFLSYGGDLALTHHLPALTRQLGIALAFDDSGDPWRGENAPRGVHGGWAS